MSTVNIVNITELTHLPLSSSAVRRRTFQYSRDYTDCRDLKTRHLTLIKLVQTSIDSAQQLQLRKIVSFQTNDLTLKTTMFAEQNECETKA